MTTPESKLLEKAEWYQQQHSVLRDALKIAEKRIEMLTFALERIAACDWPGPHGVPSRADWLQEIAKEALK